MKSKDPYCCWGIFLLWLSVTVGCKEDRLATMPNLAILLPDSFTVVHTQDIPAGRPTLLIHFDPDCRECQEQTDTLLKHMPELKDVNLYFVTMQQRMEKIRIFTDYYKLYDYPNVIIGWDRDTAMVRHFRTGSTPLLAIYDTKKKLRGVLEGKSDLTRLLATVNEINHP